MTLDEVKALISKSGQALLKSNREKEYNSFLLSQKRTTPAVRAVGEQLAIVDKFKSKLPYFYNLGGVLERDLLEQATVEPISAYRNSIINGTRLLDGTGGTGSEVFALSKSFSEIIFAEISNPRFELFKYNLNLFKINNIEPILTDSIEYLKEVEDNYFSWIFLDPARRENGKRYINLDDYSPNIIENIDLLLSKCEKLAVKISPAFDISLLKRLINNISTIRVISYRNEVREILFTIEKESEFEPFIEALEVNKNGEINFSIKANLNDKIDLKNCNIDANGYIFEPAPSIIKASLVEVIGKDNNLNRISINSPLLFGRELIPFSGRVFKVISVNSWSRKELSHYLKKMSISKASIIRRDFPISSEKIRKDYSIKEDSKRFLIFTKDSNGKKIFIDCQREN